MIIGNNLNEANQSIKIRLITPVWQLETKGTVRFLSVLFVLYPEYLKKSTLFPLYCLIDSSINLMPIKGVETTHKSSHKSRGNGEDRSQGMNE